MKERMEVRIEVRSRREQGETESHRAEDRSRREARLRLQDNSR